MADPLPMAMSPPITPKLEHTLAARIESSTLEQLDKLSADPLQAPPLAEAHRNSPPFPRPAQETIPTPALPLPEGTATATMAPAPSGSVKVTAADAAPADAAPFRIDTLTLTPTPTLQDPNPLAVPVTPPTHRPVERAVVVIGAALVKVYIVTIVASIVVRNRPPNPPTKQNSYTPHRHGGTALLKDAPC